MSSIIAASTIPAHGAHGLSFETSTACPSLCVGPPEWPTVRLGQAMSVCAGASLVVQANRGLSLHLFAEPLRAIFQARRPLSPDVVAHPGCGWVAAFATGWTGGIALHAGAFVVNERAWAVVGPRYAGKSFAMATLAARGIPVLTDDVLVIRDGIAFAGPRAIDLRPSSADVLGLVERSTPVRGRRRVALPAITPEVPFGGGIFLRWGRGPTARPLGLHERLSRVAEFCHPATGGLTASALTLVSRPFWELRRPKDFARADDVVDALLSVVS